MVVPTAIAPAFEMVEPELALQVLVNAFGPPALLEQTQKLFSRSVLVDGGDECLPCLSIPVSSKIHASTAPRSEIALTP